MLNRPLVLVAIGILGAHVVGAQGRLGGTVRDSLAHRPLANAIVQLASADDGARLTRSATSDSLGGFSFADVPSGRYLIGFIHPLLDSIGIEPITTEVRIRGTDSVRVDLATPAATRLRAAFCGAAHRSVSGTAIVGIVRDAQREPVAGVTIAAEWAEIAIGKGSIGRSTGRTSATSEKNGWFVLCGAPNAGTVFMSAASRTAATDTVPLVVQDDVLVRRDLYVGSARSARVSGRVSDPEGAPVAGARVAVVTAGGRLETRSDAGGDWSLDVPSGTRIVELRAIGYFPQRVAVDAVDEMPSVRVALSSIRAMMDTVRIKAERNGSRNAEGFELRRRSTAGRFLTAEEIARRGPVFTSDIFRTVPGMTVDRKEGTLTMRGQVTAQCAPRVFVDGAFMAELDADAIDAFVRPDEIAGMEIYMAGAVPTQFATGSFGFDDSGRVKDACGAIVIWTLPRRARRSDLI